MTQDHRALSDKQRDTLRLLLAGHDAKSIARHLGLSVHTVNERLRDARRKLGASSSREAARLLRDSEGDTPHFVADNELGDAPCPPATAEFAASTARPPIGRPAVWIAGGLAMSLIAFAVFTLSGAPPVADAPPVPASEPSVPVESAVVQSTRRWLALVDAFDWPQSWQATGQSFRTLNTAALWKTVSLKVRVPFGAVQSRTFISEDDVPTPPLGNKVVKFRTRFAGKGEAVETLALVREGGDWRVVGYYIE
jgi:DNA-binding CsgD family transcriptional regulator